jgi:hypothetical protein
VSLRWHKRIGGCDRLSRPGKTSYQHAVVLR